MTLNYQIREMKEVEYHTLEDFLYEAIFIPEGEQPPPRSIIQTPELQVYFQEFGSKKEDLAFVAEVDGRLVGAVWCRIMNDYGHVDDKTPSLALAIDKPFRSQGIGTSLLSRFLEELEARGCDRVSLAVQKENYAVTLYQKVGFQIIRETEAEYIMIHSFSNIFDQSTITWFDKTLGKPTAVQEEAWPAIHSGQDTLVSAPTGTGKTLAAFLVYLNMLRRLEREGNLQQELYLIYVSPLKSLAGDIKENLNRPLYGILEEEHASLGIQVGLRTGDTTSQERRRMIKQPPHILLTTPESLYLMLTSKSGKAILRTAKAIIIDELHVLIDTKRGAHLMLSIARLDLLCGKPLQRIGLSATIEPLELAAHYLSPNNVTIVSPKMSKAMDVRVISPLSDTYVVFSGTIWTELANKVYEQCQQARSVIAFVDGRMYAEKLAYYVNQIAGEGFARTHHGSLSKEQRLSVEQALRDGTLRLLCATSSMELGIDVGEVDQVLQIGCPRSVSSTLQRLGRAGHNPGRVSSMCIFPKTASEGLYSGMTASLVREGKIEQAHPPRLCLDILAQHLVSMATDEGYAVEEVMPILKRAYPFTMVTLEQVKSVLAMLAGDYEHQKDIPVRPRVLYDRIHGHVEGDAYSRMLAISAAGTIPDKGLYAVKTESNVKLGELDEEFVYEARIGDKFLLGTFAWKIQKIEKDSVIVAQTSMSGAQPPFWKGDIKGRGLQTGREMGKIFRTLNQASDERVLEEALLRLGLDSMAMKSAKDIIEKQRELTNVLPDDRTIVIEHFRDENGNPQMMIHSVYGRQVNAPLAILIQELITRYQKETMHYVEDDDGILVFSYGEYEIPYGVLQRIDISQVRGILEAILPTTPLFGITFRYNIAHALLMGVKKAGRQPLWVQRLRSAQMLESVLPYKEHPMIVETKRECLEELWDLKGVEEVLQQIQSGGITVYELDTEYPSPLSLTLRRQTEAAMMYNYAPTPIEAYKSAEDELKQLTMITPDEEQLEQVTKRTKLPENEQQLHSLFMIEGDLVAGELTIPVEWIKHLAETDRVLYIEPGIWIAAEHQTEYVKALMEHNEEVCLHLVQRLLRYRGAQSKEDIQLRYLWSDEWVTNLLTTLCHENLAVEQDGMYYHGKLYSLAQKQTVKSRRVMNRTFDASRYAALVVSRLYITASPMEQLSYTIRNLYGIQIPARLLETAIFPNRVANYRQELLDRSLAEGEFFWQLNTQGMVTFYPYEKIDWDRDPEGKEKLSDTESVLYEALQKRGATFMKGLVFLVNEASPETLLIHMAEMGLVHADSFAPVRQWISKDNKKTVPLKQRVNRRMNALNTGRWEVLHPVKTPSLEDKLNQLFDRSVIVCRETMDDITWQQALQVLRIWEYTGQVRRGYFIEGLSGIQFIREQEFAGTMLSLEQPREELFWICAADPGQPWGKILKHQEGRNFMNLPGTYVAIYMGQPVAVFERLGKIFRCFDSEYCQKALQQFVIGFRSRAIYSERKRIVVKEYDKEYEPFFREAGFMREMQDFSLYR